MDKKLDYHNLQKDRHPYINELRSFMEEKRRATNHPENKKMNTPHDVARNDDYYAK